MQDTWTQKLKGPDTFDQKLKAGLQGEEIARVYLESLGHKVQVPEIDPTLSLQGYRSLDLFVNGAYVEIKLDILAAKTGNVCIEHRSLETHTAPWYIWVIPQFYRISKKQLQFLVDTWPDKVLGGDDQRIQTLLKIDSDTFRENFTKI